ncbi:MAG: hypothetical protein U1F77_15235 [Kiritimatiellia bacterium]
MFAVALLVLFCSMISLALDYILLLESLKGAGPAASGLRMLATSQALVFFCIGFAAFSFIFLLALLMGLFESRAPAPAEGPASRT